MPSEHTEGIVREHGFSVILRKQNLIYLLTGAVIYLMGKK